MERLKDTPKKTPPKWRRWLKRIGIVGILFFTIKGLIWLARFFGAFKLIECNGG